MGYRPIVFQTERDFPTRPLELWEFVANTDGLNREIGMPHVTYGPLMVSADSLYREASARFWGLLKARWREYPFEWVRGERYAVLRVFEAGFLDTFYGGMELRPREQGSCLRLFAEVTPRTLVGWGMARLIGRKGIRETLALCDRFVGLRATDVALSVAPASRASAVNRPRLDQLVVALRRASLPESLVQRFARHVAAAPDREVFRMQPYALADGWGAERAEVLRLCIQAARLGALYHTWEIMCPNCRVPKAEAAALSGVPARFHCDGCGVEYGTDLAQNVELRYSIHPSLRPAKDEIYCIGGPANFPHIWVQQYLPPGTERAVRVVLPGEGFRVRALRVNVTCPLEPDSAGPAEATFTYRDDGWYQMRQTFSPGTVTVRLRNETAGIMVAVIEQIRRDPRAITAAQAMLLPEFREAAQGDPRSATASPG